MNRSNPDSYELIVLWLQTHYQGKQAVVFFGPDVEELARIKSSVKSEFRIDLDGLLFFVEVALIVEIPVAVPYDEVSSFAARCPEKLYGFVVGWNGSKVTTDNT